MIMEYIFSEEDRKDFLPSVKTAIVTKKDINAGIDLETAFRCGYLDVARAPLRGINIALQKKNRNTSSKIIRDKCIKDFIIPDMNMLFNNEIDYDGWHQDLCEKIFVFYKNNGYDLFTVGKAQKWINMSIKYACLYDYDHQSQLSKYMDVFHVPIDRYIANPLANKLHIKPPCYEKDDLDIFDADKKNYSWSNINDYDDYLICQKEIRGHADVLNKYENSPLRWEFDAWKKERDSK